MKNDPYSDLYNGYFDIRDPYTKGLDEIYKKPVPIPIYCPHEIFTSLALEEHYAAVALSGELAALKRQKNYDVNLVYSMQRKLSVLNNKMEDRDLDIFRYFHFIAARTYKLELLKSQYRVYALAKQAYYEYKEGANTKAYENHQYHKKLLLDLQSDLEEERKIAILNAY